MWALGEVNPDTLLGVAAIITALGGGIASFYQIIFGRREKKKAAEDATAKAEVECHDRLLAVQRESEALSEELHKLRMKDGS